MNVRVEGLNAECTFRQGVNTRDKKMMNNEHGQVQLCICMHFNGSAMSIHHALSLFDTHANKTWGFFLLLFLLYGYIRLAGFDEC